MRKICAIPLLAAVVVSSPFILTGCDVYNADIPEYTTERSRESSFRASTFEEQHQTVPPERSSVGDVVDEGVKSVRQAADDFGK